MTWRKGATVGSSRNRYRRLRPGEEPPPGEPARYPDSSGYIVLRWKVAPYTYVEVLEHRLVAGIPEGPVHHDNEVRDDNRPGNLLATANRSHHMQLHGAIDGMEAARLYSTGLTMAEIARLLGSHSGNVSRVLRRRGVVARPQPRRRPDVTASKVRRLARRGWRVKEIARELGCAPGTVRRVFVEAGLPVPRPGRAA